MGTPIWDELSPNIKLIQESAYKRGRIEARLELAKQLAQATKKPPMWLSKVIKDLERAE